MSKVHNVFLPKKLGNSFGQKAKTMPLKKIFLKTKSVFLGGWGD